MKATTQIYKDDDLFVIVTDWFDNPFEGNVYVNLDQANQLAGDFNGAKVTSLNTATVMSLSDYYCHIRNKQSQSEHYGRQ